MDLKNRPDSAFDMWAQSVVIEIEHEQDAAHLIISNTKDAAECLTQLWPDRESAEYSRALAMCGLALNGQLNHADARSAFVEAAREAGIMVSLH